MKDLGKGLLLLGSALFFLGGAFWLFSDRLGWLGKLGKLPGDMHFQGKNVAVFLPITTMLLVSLALSVIWNLFGRWFR